MGNKLSKKNHDDKQTLKRFDSDFKKVNSYIEEAKQSEEQMDFEEASSLYMHALKVVYTFIDENKVPDEVSQEIATFVVDMIKKREELKEYKKMYDIAKASYKEDNKRFKEEDRQLENEGQHVEAAANEGAADNEGAAYVTSDDDEDEQQELRFTWEEMSAVFHCNEEIKKQIIMKKMNKKQRFKLECQILNKRAEDDEEDEATDIVQDGEARAQDDKDDRADEGVDDEESDEVEYQEEPIHFTDKKDVQFAMKAMEKRKKISRQQFETDSAYVLHLTQSMLDDNKIKGITVDQLVPLVNRIVWERGMEQKNNEENSQWTQLKVEKLVQDMKDAYEKKFEELQNNSKTQKKENDTQKELKEIYDALNAKLQKPGRDIKDCVTFNSIIGLHAVKRALDTGIQVPLLRPELVASGDIQHYEGLLLFGPPGTGKSMIAKALANEAQNCSFIQVDRADLVSKWQGQSEKIVTTLFKIARENKPCIVFVDEIEGLMEDRDGEGSSNGSKVVTVLLTAMQNLGRDQVFVLGASNYPWKLDKAFYRRFSQIVYVPLPNFGERVQIFKANIYKNNITTRKQITHSDIEQLALLTEQYSGSHIARVMAAALAIRYQRVSKIKYFKKSIKGKNYWQPCTKEEEGAKKMSITKVPKIVMPPLLMEDLEMALFEIKNNIETEYLKKLVKWGEKNFNMTE